VKKYVLVVLLVSKVYLGSAQSSKENFQSYQQSIPGSSLQFKMVPIQAGSFLMGSPSNEKNREKEEGPQKKINISAFWMSETEVIRDVFDVFLKDEKTSQNIAVDAITRPSPQYVDLTWGMGKEGGYPANSMSQYAAIMYCRWLYQKTGIFYRLPTEAEWEYACRAGTNTSYFFGNDSKLLNDYAWFIENSEEKYQKVAQKKPNPWGLYDMLGNLLEWTLDHYDEKLFTSLPDNAVDPIAPPKALVKYPKTLRGGSFEETAFELRSATRFHSDPTWNKRDPQIPKSKWWLTEARGVGIRLVRPIKQPTSTEANQFFKNYLGL